MINIKENYESIYDKCSEKLYRTILLYCKNKTDAEDIIQNTFLKLYVSNMEFDTLQHIQNWLFKTAINDAKNILKSKWKLYVPFEEKMGDVQFIENSQVDTYLYEQILKLPYKYRVVILLYYYDEYSVKEISELLNLKESTIQTQLQRAREKLKKNMEVNNGKNRPGNK